MRGREPNRAANIWVARGVPVFLLAIIGYASWVITKTLCVDYLLNPRSSEFLQPQNGPAVAILVIYYLLLLITLVCYTRLVYVVTRNPGLVPRGAHWYKEQRRKRKSSRSRSGRRHRKNIEKVKDVEADSTGDAQMTEAVTKNIAVDAEVTVEHFWQRDIFTCNYDGRPAFCSSCYNWKPDRAHHCSELDRCVLKMDHFCPWVGGVVGETSFKFFVQFTFWGALYCTHILVAVAYYFALRKRSEDVINVHWAVILGLSGLFALFSAGMCMSSLQFVFINSTTIENLSRKSKVWYLAIYVPPALLQSIEDRGRSNLRFISYPRPAEEQFRVLEQNGADVSQEELNDSGPHAQTPSPATSEPRTFAILETTPGMNPFDLGPKQNFLDMMGANVAEWFLPIRASPFVNHESSESFYKVGPVVDQLRLDARIGRERQPKPQRRHRKRKQRRALHKSKSSDQPTEA